jgi:hypothetical protein
MVGCHVLVIGANSLRLASSDRIGDSTPYYVNLASLCNGIINAFSSSVNHFIRILNSFYGFYIQGLSLGYLFPFSSQLRITL